MTIRSPDDPGSRRRPHAVNGGVDRYEALLEVLEQQAERASHEPGAPVRSHGGRWRGIVLAVLVGVTAWVWIAPPAWLVPPGPGPAPIEEEEAALRFRMYLQAQRIRSFELSRGRLPATLEEAGEAAEGLEYELVAPGIYALTGETERLRITYRSDAPLKEWVGSGGAILDGAVP